MEKNVQWMICALISATLLVCGGAMADLTTTIDFAADADIDNEGPNNETPRASNAATPLTWAGFSSDITTDDSHSARRVREDDGAYIAFWADNWRTSCAGSYTYTHWPTAEAGASAVTIRVDTDRDPGASIRLLIGSATAWYISSVINADHDLNFRTYALADLTWAPIPAGPALTQLLDTTHAPGGEESLGNVGALTYGALASLDILGAGVYVETDEFQSDSQPRLNSLSVLGPGVTTIPAPNVIGMTQAQAEAAITAAGLTPNPDITDNFSRQTVIGLVDSQTTTPWPGARVPAGSTFNFNVTTGYQTYFEWNGGADFGAQASWTPRGGATAALGGAIWPPDNTEEYLQMMQDGTATLTSNFVVTERLWMNGGTNLVIGTGGTFDTSDDSSIIGISINASQGKVATLTIDGGTWKDGGINIGDVGTDRAPHPSPATAVWDEWVAATEGVVIVKNGGTIDLTRGMRVGDREGTAPDDTSSAKGTLILEGSTNTVNFERWLEMEGPNAKIKFVADAAGFTQMVVGSDAARNGDKFKIAGQIEIDGSAYTGGAASWALITYDLQLGEAQITIDAWIATATLPAGWTLTHTPRADNDTPGIVTLATDGTPWPGGEGEGEGEGEPGPAGRTITSNVYPPFIDEGTVVILTAPAGGTAHQWKKGGVNIGGATNGTLVFDPVTEEDAGIYTVEYNDGTKVVVLSDPFNLIVQPEGSVPAAGLLGLVALVGACGLGGARLIRRRR